MKLYTNPHLVIIILSWDCIQDTLACLKSAACISYSNFDILVVDNANRAELQAILARDFPGVHLIQNQNNLGYAAGNNIGIRWALEREASYILLLNDDITLEPDACGHLIELASGIPHIAAVGGKIRPLRQPFLLWSAGEAFPRQAPVVRDDGQYDSPRQIRYAAGGCILLTRAALVKVGLIDEAFFMVHEEKDWCYRAAQAGFLSWYTPRSIAWHALDHSFTSRWSPSYHYLYVRNNLYFWQKHLCASKSGINKVRQAASYGWQEIVFIRRHGRQPFQRGCAGIRGAWDFLSSKFGAPPRGL